ncbi:hypothetical protein N8D56_03435 [Devosia sp. A8/3-2]|nr:hypothetical protein N8D56_03435 [Devosia sp. A8/3-2]
MTIHADAPERLATYRRLVRRNRIVSILRIGVPALGALTLVLLAGQIYLSSIGTRFGVGQISVSRDGVSVDAPEYAGLLDDGAAYRVTAEAARAAMNATDRIELSDAVLEVDRTSGVSMRASSDAALLDTTNQVVFIDGVAHFTDSTGTKGILHQSEFDWAQSVLTAKGPVTINYSDGSDISAAGMVYDAKQQTRTFTRAIVTLPSTPGETIP